MRPAGTMSFAANVGEVTTPSAVPEPPPTAKEREEQKEEEEEEKGMCVEKEAVCRVLGEETKRRRRSIRNLPRSC